MSIKDALAKIVSVVLSAIKVVRRNAMPMKNVLVKITSTAISKVVLVIKLVIVTAKEVTADTLAKIAASPKGTHIVKDNKIRFVMYLSWGLAICWLLFKPSSTSNQPSLIIGAALFAICWLLFIGAKRSDGTTSKVLAFSGIGVLIFSILIFTGFHDILRSYLRNMPFNRGEGWFFLGGLGLIYWSQKIQNEKLSHNLSYVGYIFVWAAIAVYFIRHTVPDFDLQPPKNLRTGADGTWFHWKEKPILNDSIVIGGVILTFLSWHLFNTKRHIRGTIVAFIAIPLLFTGVNKYFIELGQALKNTPVIKLFVDSDNNTAKNSKTSSALASASEVFKKNFDSLAQRFDADASRSLTVSRNYSQEKRTWSIAPGTLIYSCTTAACVPISLSYTKSTEIISSGEEVKVNGVLYEKFSLPDPQTGQIGVHAGFIPSGKFLEKSENRNSIEKSITPSESSTTHNVLSQDLDFTKGSFYIALTSLKPGMKCKLKHKGGKGDTEIALDPDGKQWQVLNEFTVPATVPMVRNKFQQIDRLECQS